MSCLLHLCTSLSFRNPLGLLSSLSTVTSILPNPRDARNVTLFGQQHLLGRPLPLFGTRLPALIFFPMSFAYFFSAVQSLCVELPWAESGPSSYISPPNNLTYFHDFKYYMYEDKSQIYISIPDLFSEFIFCVQVVTFDILLRCSMKASQI